jgi:ATP-dependent DNA ligase
VFDAVVVEGYDLKNYPFSQRKEAYEGAVKNLKPPLGLLIQPKLWYPLSGAAEIWASVRVLCDGLILQPLQGKLKAGIQADVFKWKPVDLQTVDFYISVPMQGHVLLECGHGADIIGAAEIGCYFDNTAPCTVVFTDKRQVYECCFSRFTPEDNKLFFAVVKPRLDKTYANDARVVISTLRSIQENIMVEELAHE